MMTSITAAVSAMTKDDPTEAQIVHVIATIRDAYPDLSLDGFLIDMRFRQRDAAERRTRHEASRAEMTRPESVRQFRVAWKFLMADGGPLLTQKVNRTCGTSYSWKHVAEDFSGGYCSNGMFIVAALAAGCSIERTAPDDLNAWLNLSASMLPVEDRRTGRRRWRDRHAVRARTQAA